MATKRVRVTLEGGPEKKKKPDGSTFIKKVVKSVVVRNGVLPILEYVYLSKDQLQVTDLETAVVLPFKSGIEACVPAEKFLDVLDLMEEPVFKCDKNFGIEATAGTRKVKVMGENPDQFPLIFQKEDYFELGEIDADMLTRIAIALKFVSNDDLRPALTGVFFGKDIASTDAHRLYWHPIEPMMQEFIMPAKAAKIILGIGASHWRVFGTPESHLVLISDTGVMVTTRGIDARYPDYPVVIPRDEHRALLTVNPDALRREIKIAMKFGNVTTKQVTFCVNGKVEVKSQDVDFSHEYTNELTGSEAEAKFYKVKDIPIGTPVTVAGRAGHVVGHGKDNEKVKFDDQTSLDKPIEVPTAEVEMLPELCVAFNGEFLDEVAAILKDQPIEMKLWSPTKATVINDCFVIMPLMLNQ